MGVTTGADPTPRVTSGLTAAALSQGGGRAVADNGRSGRRPALHRLSGRQRDAEAAMAGPVVESVNVGRPRAVPWRGETVVTAIWKAPVAGRVPVRGVNVDGDEQGDPEVHGGVDKALYTYAGEDADWWAEQLRREVGPGSFGENLTTRGLDVTGAVIGERWRAGGVLLEVSSPRVPCFKLGIRMGSQQFPRRFAAAGRPRRQPRHAGEPAAVGARRGRDRRGPARLALRRPVPADRRRPRRGRAADRRGTGAAGRRAGAGRAAGWRARPLGPDATSPPPGAGRRRRRSPRGGRRPGRRPGRPRFF